MLHIRSTAAALLAGFACTFALAQDDAVVVQATRFPEDVRRLPASTTILTAEDIARSSARTLPDLLSEQVGITAKDFYGNNAARTSIDLRGFGITGPQNTLVLLDGRRLNDFDLSGVHWASIPLAGIERIEILRGTGSVLYGEGASAGVVNIITRSPLKKGPVVEAFGRAGSHDTYEAQLYGSLSGDTVGVNGSVYGYESDGYRFNNRNEQRNATLGLRWALGDTVLDLRAGADRQDVRLPGARIVQPSIGLDEYATDPRGAQTPLDFASQDGERVGLGWLQRIGEAELSVNADYRSKDQRSYFDQGGFPSYRADELSLTSFSPRLRIPVTAGAMSHRLTAGVDLHQWQYDSRRTDRPENIATPTNIVRVEQESQAVYLQDVIQVTASTVATIGARRERARYRADDTVDPTAPACFFCAAAPSARETLKGTAWELGLRQSLGDEWAVFARAGRSFRFVNAEEIYENDAFFAPQFQILRPQRTRTHEIGGEWRRGGHALRAALFRMDVTDEIHLDPFTTGVGNTNLPPSRRQGVELEGRWQASRNLSVSAGYAYTEARFLEGTLAGSPFAIGTGLPIGGRRVPLVPEHKLNVALAWDATPQTRLSAALTAVSDQVLDNDEPNTLGHRIPAYSVIDFKVVRAIGRKLRLGLAVNNVLDEEYYTYAARSAFVPDRYAVYPLPGRTFSVSAEVQLP